MTARCVSRVFALLVVVGTVLTSADGYGGTPLDTVKESNNRVLEIYATGGEVTAETEKRIYDIVDGVTDYDAIAAGATGRICRTKLKEEECSRFKEVFTRLLRVSAIKKLGRYRADSFEYLGEEVNGKEALVRTAANFKEERFMLDYLLGEKEGHWVIVNYIVEDVDTVRNYRKQFARMFAKMSYQKVVEKLEKRILAYEKE